jgi:hypothetical protein
MLTGTSNASIPEVRVTAIFVLLMIVNMGKFPRVLSLCSLIYTGQLIHKHTKKHMHKQIHHHDNIILFSLQNKENRLTKLQSIT